MLPIQLQKKSKVRIATGIIVVSLMEMKVFAGGLVLMMVISVSQFCKVKNEQN